MPSHTIEIKDEDETVHFHYKDHEEEPCHYNEVVTLTNKWQYNMSTEQFLRKIPKVELHVHLDGSFEPSLLFDHLRETGDYSCLPDQSYCPWDQSMLDVRTIVEKCETEDSFRALCTCRGKRSLNAMLENFTIFIPIVRGNLVLIENLAMDFVKRQAKQNCIYTEVRYSPHLLAEGGDIGGSGKVDPRPVVDAVTRGLREGEKLYGVKVNQILCCINWKPDWADDVVDIAHERKDDFPCSIVGIDIAAGEEHFDEDNFSELHNPHNKAFQRAQELGLNVTIHAGEVGDSKFVRKAVNEYGATRIGHGYQIAKEPNLMEEMRRKNIHFELCPTSSDETGGWSYHDEESRDWMKHPAKAMLRYGLNCGFNSDDPAVFATSLTWQYRIAIGKIGLTKHCIVKALQHSINSAFIDDDTKAALRTRVEDFLENTDTF
ncbi:adenosine deaminase [Chaetoceros tenuissimus]|uniref:adenosine deaminase n=1 Tax=Chaetoceros tenuissimus TaxID=426638 RepID=A0AAD3HEC8_9STRA|nr:adenosine deaminase [Chaetoceros tenuissimus]